MCNPCVTSGHQRAAGAGVVAAAAGDARAAGGALGAGLGALRARPAAHTARRHLPHPVTASILSSYPPP